MWSKRINGLKVNSMERARKKIVLIEKTLRSYLEANSFPVFSSPSLGRGPENGQEKWH